MLYDISVMKWPVHGTITIIPFVARFASANDCWRELRSCGHGVSWYGQTRKLNESGEFWRDSSVHDGGATNKSFIFFLFLTMSFAVRDFRPRNIHKLDPLLLKYNIYVYHWRFYRVIGGSHFVPNFFLLIWLECLMKERKLKRIVKTHIAL